MNDHTLARKRLRFFAESTVSRAPLYSILSAAAAEDKRIPGLLTAAVDRDADAPLLFAAVQHLLRRDHDHRLASYYRTLGGRRTPDDAVWPTFREFVEERRETIRDLIQHRYVQCNEVRRIGALHPAITAICSGIDEPVALVEVGCSAGLLLSPENFRIHYRFEDGRTEIVQPNARVDIDCAVRGGDVVLPKGHLNLAERIGLDRHPVASSKEDHAWLESCVWADHPHRLRLLRHALAAREGQRITLLKGEAVNDLRRAVDHAPAFRPVIVLTSWLLLYMQEHDRRAFIEELRMLAGSRRLWWIDVGPYEEVASLLFPVRTPAVYRDLAYTQTGHGVLTITDWQSGPARPRVIATTEPHGASMRWLHRNPLSKVFTER